MTVVDVDLPSADPAPISVRACAAIHAADPPSPLVVVAPSASSGIVQSVALAQRRGGRLVIGYVLLDPREEPMSQEWPDAPVVVLDSGDGFAANQARLHGWSHAPLTSASEFIAAVRNLTN